MADWPATRIAIPYLVVYEHRSSTEKMNATILQTDAVLLAAGGATNKGQGKRGSPG